MRGLAIPKETKSTNTMYFRKRRRVLQKYCLKVTEGEPRRSLLLKIGKNYPMNTMLIKICIRILTIIRINTLTTKIRIITMNLTIEIIKTIVIVVKMSTKLGEMKVLKILKIHIK